MRMEKDNKDNSCPTQSRATLCGTHFYDCQVDSE